MKSKKIVFSQFDIDRLQETLNKELKKRAEKDNVTIEEKMKREGKSATIVVPVMLNSHFNTVNIDYMELDRQY